MEALNSHAKMAEQLMAPPLRFTSWFLSLCKHSSCYPCHFKSWTSTLNHLLILSQSCLRSNCDLRSCPVRLSMPPCTR